jgi:hypothetical protein
LSGVMVFPELSKLLRQERALGAPCLDTVILAPRRRALAGCGQAYSVTSKSHYGWLHRTSGPAGADAFAVVGGGCTGRAHGCKAKQGRRDKGGADVCY